MNPLALVGPALHAAVSGLAMSAMELMAIVANPAELDRAGLKPGDQVRLAVRADGDRVTLVWIERQERR